MVYGPITSWQIDGETVEIMTDFIFLGSKITADDDCSHKIKRRLLLGRKAMTNLDSVLKSRGITLLKKVHIVKAVVFPLVAYACESWTLKKAEHWRTDSFKLCSWRLLRVLDSEIKPVHPKGNQPWIFIGRTELKLMLKYFGYLMQRVYSLETTLMLGKTEGKRRGLQRMRWLESISSSMSINLNKLQEIVEDRGAWHAAVHRVAKSDTS